MITPIHISRPALHAALLLAATSLTLGAATAADSNRNWPQWRGPNANGIVLNGNPPLEWSEQKNVKWKVALPGLGHATPAIGT